MAIGNEQTPVKVRTYKEIPDEYGQVRKEYIERSSSMYLKRWTHTTVEDPRFQKVAYLGLTKDTVTDRDDVIVGDKVYHVFLFTKTPRWNVAYLEYEY